MTTHDRLPAGIYLSPRHDDMVVMVDAGGFPRPVSEDYNTLISHNGQPDHLAKLWGPLTPAKVVPADAIVIDRDDLPAVKERHPGGVETPTFVFGADTNPATLRRQALELLALAEHLEAYPPVDEAQVHALAELLAEDARDHTGIDASAPWSVARRLVAAGVRAPQTGDDQ